MNSYQILKAFIQFLKENNCYKEFRENINSQHSTKDFKKWFNYLKENPRLRILYFTSSWNTFEWEKTSQKRDFWYNIFNSTEWAVFKNTWGL